MASGQRSFQVTSKFIALYAKFLDGLTPNQIAPREDHDQFFTNLFNLEVKKEYLRDEFSQLSKDSCLGKHKPFLNLLFRECLVHARSAPYDDVRKVHALETLSIVLRCILSKNPTGWEVMEILGGGVGQSDEAFMILITVVDHIMGDKLAPVRIRHLASQVALTYMCAVGQLSPGAYFLRRDLFPSITAFIKSCNTEGIVSENALLLAILANFHKSEAARLNPYLKCLRTTTDTEVMHKICWATNTQLVISIQGYRDISDDSMKSTITTTFGSMFSSFRPDRALTMTTSEPPRELFKDQPTKEAVYLLPIFELLRANALFSAVIMKESSPDKSTTGRIPSLPYTILTLSSYILTHASSTSSPRSLSYANLCLHVLLALVENNGVMNALTQSCEVIVPICRQRLPHLSLPKPKRPAICALLDCCVLWLRHNLHKRLEVYSYINCIHICYRIVWYLQNGRLRLGYEWKELWNALLGLLGFLSTKLDSLDTTGGVEQIVRETVVLLDLALSKSDVYLPSPEALHEFIYELIRSASILKSQETLLRSLTVIPQPDSRQAAWTKRSTEGLASITEIAEFYSQKVNAAGARTARTAMGIVAKDIEANGLHMTKHLREGPVPTRSEDFLDFVRYGCSDGLALMP